MLVGDGPDEALLRERVAEERAGQAGQFLSIYS